MNETKENLSVVKRIIKLQEMPLKDLTKMWRTMFDYEPEIESRKYIIAKIAYKIQEQIYGRLDEETENKIKACSKEVTRKCAKVVSSDKKSQKFSPMIGSKIVKEYRDKVHEVIVVKEGFSYEGLVYKSLSAIAMKITGTKWNGLKFFDVGAR